MKSVKQEQPGGNKNVTAEESVKLDPETKQLKDRILRKILHIKFTNIGERERISKIRTDKKVKKLTERTKTAVKEILNKFE